MHWVGDKMEKQRVIITSANAPHYIALEGDDQAEWRWTRNIGTAYRFQDRTAAEAFAARCLQSMGPDVWYLGNLY